jgi:hypothetical protein
MRKITAVVASAVLGAAALTSAGQATASAPTVQAVATATVAPKAPARVVAATGLGSEVGQTGSPGQKTGWKLGRLPAAGTLCIANGVDSYFATVIGRLNTSAFYPNIAVLNRCDGYSIENRMTIDNYSDSTAVCSKFTNTGRAWDAAQGYYVWNQNPVLWYNTSDYCLGAQPVMDHRIDMYVEYILGLQYVSDRNWNATICSTSWCFYNVRYPTLNDTGGTYGLAKIYGGEA